VAEAAQQQNLNVQVHVGHMARFPSNNGQAKSCIQSELLKEAMWFVYKRQKLLLFTHGEKIVAR